MSQKRDFAARLLAWRKAKKLGRHAGAIELKVSKSTLRNWEQRTREPLLSTAAHVLARLEKDGF